MSGTCLYALIGHLSRRISMAGKETMDKQQNITATQRTIDNITYTIIASSSPTATQTLQQKLEAMIARDISKLAAKPVDL